MIHLTDISRIGIVNGKITIASRFDVQTLADVLDGLGFNAQYIPSTKTNHAIVTFDSKELHDFYERFAKLDAKARNSELDAFAEERKEINSKNWQERFEKTRDDIKQASQTLSGQVSEFKVVPSEAKTIQQEH